MTREDQIRKKAKELGQQYFPDSANIWARSNVEACYVENACVEMAEWADQHPQWIPVVSRKMPTINRVSETWDCSDDVYIYLVTGSCCVGRYEHDKSTNEFYWVLYGVEKDTIVTHWMPIVPPRKEE